MPVTVAGNLVARRVDGADQARLTVRDPAEDEKRGADTSIFKGIENLVRSNFDTRLERIPLRAIHAALECRDVVVILHVDRQGVAHSRRCMLRFRMFEDRRHGGSLEGDSWGGAMLTRCLCERETASTPPESRRPRRSGSC